MLRGINNSVPKGWVRLSQLNLHSNSQSTIQNTSNKHEKKTDHAILRRILGLRDTKNKENNQIVSLDQIWFKNNFCSAKSFLAKYFEKYKKESCNGRKNEDLYTWFTGVLALSGVIISHKWMQHGKNDKCPWSNLSSASFHRAVIDTLPRDHILLAINSTESSSTQHEQIPSKESEKLSAGLKLDEAVSRFHKVVQDCNGSVMNKLALKLQKMNQHKKGFELLEQASTYGYVPSLFNLGICYELGLGVEQSTKEAAQFYEKAADLGHVKAMYNIATFYYEGLVDGDKCDSKGFYYMKQAANHGMVKAQSFVALRYTKEKQWKEAVNYFEMASNNNDLSSTFNLAICYEYGFGVNKNLTKANTLYHKAARKGHILSQFNLGEAYHRGTKGCEKDDKKAMKWYKNASEQGHRESENRLNLLKYEISQRNEDILLKTLESNPIIRLLQPIQSMKLDFHKSSSMPILKDLTDSTQGLSLKTYHSSMRYIGDTYNQNSGVDMSIASLNQRTRVL